MLIRFNRYEIQFDDSRNKATQGTQKKLLTCIEEWVEGAAKFMHVLEDIMHQVYKDVTSATIYLPSQLDARRLKLKISLLYYSKRLNFTLPSCMVSAPSSGGL